MKMEMKAVDDADNDDNENAGNETDKDDGKDDEKLLACVVGQKGRRQRTSCFPPFVIGIIDRIIIVQR